MDVLLLMSILSATPEEISGGHRNLIVNNRQDVKKTKNVKDDDGKTGTYISPCMKQQGKPKFAPEFDGLNCFETLVFH